MISLMARRVIGDKIGTGKNGQRCVADSVFIIRMNSPLIRAHQSIFVVEPPLGKIPKLDVPEQWELRRIPTPGVANPIGCLLPLLFPETVRERRRRRDGRNDVGPISCLFGAEIQC